MNQNSIYFFLTLLFIPVLISAQYNGNRFSVSVNYSYNTVANIFLSPNAEEIVSRANKFEIEGIHSYSTELRYGITSQIILGISIEYMKDSGKGRNLPSDQFLVRDGFELIPIEFSGYYFLPFSTENFKFFMGGGIGFYFGKRTREFGDIEFEDVDSEVGFSIQVNTGMDYMILDFLSVRGELRFRDPEFTITNKYSKDTVTYNGREYDVTTKNIDSNLNLAGITFRIGIVYHF